MKNGMIRGYYHLSEAYYAEANLRGADFEDEICFGYYRPEGGCGGEMTMRWIRLGGDRPTPCLRVFDDAWAVLWDFQDVLAHLKTLDRTDPTPRQIRDVLDACGFVDLTPRERPRID